MNSTDIEAYVGGATPEAVLEALSTEIGTFEFEGQIAQGCNLYLAASVKLLLDEGSQDGYDYVCVWVRGTDHWQTSAGLARFLSNVLCTPVRCDPGPEYPQVSPYSSTFLEISNGTEVLLEWG